MDSFFLVFFPLFFSLWYVLIGAQHRKPSNWIFWSFCKAGKRDLDWSKRWYDLPFPPVNQAYQLTDHLPQLSVRSSGHRRSSRKSSSPTALWSCCYHPHWSCGTSFPFSAWSCWLHGHQLPLLFSSSFSRPPSGWCCFGKMDKLGASGMPWLGPACCSSKGKECIEHTWHGRSFGLQLWKLAQSKWSIALHHHHHWSARKSSFSMLIMFENLTEPLHKLL